MGTWGEPIEVFSNTARFPPGSQWTFAGVPPTDVFDGMQSLPQAPSRLAEVNRMLAAETERLQDTARQLKLQQGQPRIAPCLGGGCTLAVPGSATPIDLRSPSHTPRGPFGFEEDAAAELRRSHREAQETMRRLQRELGLAEASLHQACADGVHLQAIEARAAQRELEQYYETEMHQARHEHRLREEALEGACEQLKAASQRELSTREATERLHQAELERLARELRDAEARERRSRADGEELRHSVRRLQAERDADRGLVGRLEQERDSLASQVRVAQAELGDLRVAELEDRALRQRAEESGRTLAEEKLRLHADRGRLREAHQQAERELQAESQALREARRALERARGSEAEAERRWRRSAAEASESALSGARSSAAAAGEDARLAELIRVELADFVQQRALERHDWQETEQRTLRERDLERRCRGEVEARLQGLLSRLEQLVADSARPRALEACLPQVVGDDEALQRALAEARARASSLEAALEQERARGLAERKLARQAEANEQLAREAAERRCGEARQELERLRAEVQRLQAAQDAERLSLEHERSRLSTRGSADVKRLDDELRAMKANNSELQSATALQQRAAKEADGECRRLRAELARELRSREDAEARLLSAEVTAAAPSAPALRPALRQREPSVGRAGRCVRLEAAEVPRQPAAALKPALRRGAVARAALAPRHDGAPRRPRTAFQEELAQLPKDLRETLSAATGEALEAIAFQDAGVDESRERSVMVRLYVIMAEMLDLPTAATLSPEFQRLWRYLERSVETPTSPGSSDGTRTPPEVLFEQRRPHRLL